MFVMFFFFLKLSLDVYCEIFFLYFVLMVVD